MSSHLRAHMHGRDENGATAVEYALLIALIAAVIASVVGIVGGTVFDIFDETSTWAW